MTKIACLIGITLICINHLNASEKSNVIIIMADDLGIGDVSCYGSTMIKTPSIDQLAREGLTFNRYYTAGAVCTPTRYSILTGYYPVRCKELVDWSLDNWSWEGNLLIDPTRLTLASLFKQMGYKTAAIGKWHLGYGKEGIPDWDGSLTPGPNELGFDYHWGVPMNHNDNIRGYVENDRLFGLDPNSSFQLSARDQQVQGLLHQRVDDQVNAVLTERVMNFIRTNRDMPFFVYFTPTIAHTHITPYADFRGTSEAGQYGDFVQELDYYVGKIMNLLDELHISENTLLIFTSDNGGALNDVSSAGLGINLEDESGNVAVKARSAKKDARLMGHKTNLDLREGKASPYEGGFRVPLIIRWPAKIEAGATSSKLINSVDYLATFADLFNLELPKNSGGDSFSFADVLNGNKVEQPRSDVVLYSKKALSFVVGEWKVVDFSYGLNPKNICELYNLMEDPSESNNLAEKEPERLNELKMKLKRIVEEDRR